MTRQIYALDDFAPLWFGLTVFHIGDPYPGPDRLHIVTALPWDLSVPWFAWTLYLTTEPPALALAKLFLARPRLPQDLCWGCHPFRDGPDYPRWNLSPPAATEPVTPVEYRYRWTPE